MAAIRSPTRLMPSTTPCRAGRRAVFEERDVLAGMVASRRGRIAAMIGGEQQSISRAYAL